MIEWAKVVSLIPGKDILNWILNRVRKLWEKKLSVSANSVFTPVYAVSGASGQPVQTNGTSLFLRLRIQNPTPQAATEVEAVVEEIGESRPDGTFARIRQGQYPKPLVWSNTQNATSMPLLNRGPGKHVDLGHIHEPALRSFLNENPPGAPPAPGAVALFVETNPYPLDASHILPATSYRFGVVLSASNIDPINMTADIELTGAWDPNDAARVVKYAVRPGKPTFTA